MSFYMISLNEVIQYINHPGVKLLDKKKGCSIYWKGGIVQSKGV